MNDRDASTNQTLTAAEFETVYESRMGLPVRLEATQRLDPAGAPYTHHRLSTADGRPGAVVIATDHDDVLLVRSDRISAGKEIWELPRGSGELEDASDSSLQTGIRELQEETGFRSESAELLGSYVIDSSIYPQSVNVVLCNVSQDAVPEETDGEVLEARWVCRAELRDLISDGTICDAHSLAGIALWLVRDS